MSTVAEIEAAMAALSPEETEALEKHLHHLNSLRRQRQKTFTARDAVDWWQTHKPMAADEAEAFAHDVELARRESTSPPIASRWE